MPVFGWVFLLIVLGGIIVGSLVQKHRYRNMNLIYTAFGQENYFNVTAKLKADGVPYKVRIPGQAFGDRERSIIDNTQYDIYVKKADAHLAADALRK
ncbi:MULTISPECIES: hypothetical protein [Fictibacillus]|jgi:protein associated with RNAse G/E|uniref:hypothetical protein n=1 Tax=Fictibacillus TaxID=1329200 RepID=UPI001E5A558B|nr:hypothetical protein [Fictibacillus sp. 26RED30]